jgi:hypothetical protein
MKVVIRKNPEVFKRLRTKAEALIVSPGDFAGPVLVRLGQVHRRQEKAIFASQGAAGGSGRWPKLSPGYAKWKKRVFPGRKILVLSGEMKERFTVPSRPEYVQRFTSSGQSGGVFSFGAIDEVAVKHYRGIKLPVRDMITKTAAQITELRNTFISWYAARVRQIVRATSGRKGA